MAGRIAHAVVATVTGGLLLAGCGGGSSPDRSASPTPTTPAAEQLAALAQAGTSAAYVATYELRTGSGGPPAPTSSPTPATAVVYRSPTALRLDVISKTGIAVLVENGQGRFSCRVAGAKKVCFKVAPSGGTLPPEFDPGLQRVFKVYLEDLAQHADDYRVRRAGTTDARGDLPAGTCFTVAATASSSPTATPSPAGGSDRAIPGTYCLSDEGVVTEVRFESGSLDLKKLAPAPTAKQLQPPVSPTPLPSAPTG